MKICAVTCTGLRPELLKLCERWIAEQTVQPDHWIVSYDDGPKPIVTDAEIIEAPAMPEDWGKKKDVAPQNWHLHWALGKVPKDHVAIVFEDDDYYYPDHIAECMKWIDRGCQITCQAVMYGFNPPMRNYGVHAKRWPTEGLVGLSPAGIDIYRHILPKMRNHPFAVTKPEIMGRKETCVQIKGAGRGLPGRPGTTAWQVHGAIDVSFPDPNYEVFIDKVGKRVANAYIGLIQKTHAIAP